MRNRGSSVIIENNKVALIKRVRVGQEYYVFPGGGIENGESPEQAAIRETFEELGVHIDIKDDLGIVHHNGIQYFFTAEITGGIFGAGGGDEFTDKFRNRGTYEPMWIELERLLSLDVRPIEIAEKLHLLHRP
ncbi:NUDIX domain-containing protein [Sporosarcina limicola]|uniref:8-oxo-dGTP pyrophosphatase MutT (NUDIX family) n=1 Tax=Sporosarcina limicola TaxID=34101 RepID=A0A927R2U8_9BACL|nr:8-oxo-dGTP pyrophosphatase MutT (NUDIX family) [Sporosarcina limicola]